MLTISNADSGNSRISSDSLVVIEGNQTGNNEFIEFVTPNDHQSGFLFTDGAADGYHTYVHGGTPYHKFGTGNADRVYINASGVEVVTGNVSGSSTSTGSFGDGRFANKVGIGTTAPDGPLHVHASTAGSITANTNFDDLVLETSAHTGMTIFSGTNSDGAIYFGDSGGNNRGQLKYGHGTDAMTFATADGAASLTLDSGLNALFAGNVSGSSTSTGSFGHLFVGPSTSMAERVDLWVKNTIGATAIIVGDGSADTSVLKLGTSHGRHWSFVALPHNTNSNSAYDLRIGYTADTPTDTNELSGSILLTNLKSVGIGQTAPSSANNMNTFLHIGDSGDAQSGICIEDDESKWEIVHNGDLAFRVGTTHYFRISAGDVTVSTGNLVFGTGGKGIEFDAYATSGNPSSNLLDDYEEGTWNPTWVTGGNGTAVFTYQADTGAYYTKIGRMVYISGVVRTGDVAITANSDSGALLIGNLPFTTGARTDGDNADDIINLKSEGNWDANEFPEIGRINRESTTFNLFYATTSGATLSTSQFEDLHLTAYCRTYFSGHYRV
jgi:hypothetical protein